jgi:membrane associated rhomboid family serine protease
MASSPSAHGRTGMFGQSDSNDYQPLGYLGRIPLYVTTLLVIVYSVVMVALALARAAEVPDFTYLLVYDSDSVLRHFQFWRFFTYPLINAPSIWFAVEMWLLYSFGREVEKFIGRASFGMLYVTLVVVGPCLLTAAAVFTHGLPLLAGSYDLDFAVFIAFCAIYPNAEVFFSFKAKWIAAVFLGIYSLQLLAGHDIPNLFIFWATCLAAFLFIKYLRGHIGFRFSLRDYLRRRRSRRNLRPLPSPRAISPGKPPTPHDDVIESIDPLLDKIAKHGIASLTAREREKLEQARAELLKKPSS